MQRPRKKSFPRRFAGTSNYRADLHGILLRYCPAMFRTTPAAAKPEPSTQEKSKVVGRCSISIAVDVSTSTTGAILAYECETVSSICESSTAPSHNRPVVLPWSGRAHRPLSPDAEDIYRLSPSFGTLPTVLIDDVRARRELEKSDMWMLFTDGQIAPHTIHQFSAGISQIGIHGKACVIAIFGYKPEIPLLCDISVGTAVFATVPDCLFLFCDAQTGEVHILQAKGCFRCLLPVVSEQLILDEDTTWESLPQTQWQSILEVTVPVGAKVDATKVALSGGEQIVLEDLFQDRCSEATIDRILDNDELLNTILMTAELRDKTTEFMYWINSQIPLDREAHLVERTDEGHRAETIVSEIVDMLSHTDETGEQPDSLNRLRAQLREAHAANYLSLKHRVAKRLNAIANRRVVVHDAMARIQQNEQEHSKSSRSLSSVSPQAQRKQRVQRMSATHAVPRVKAAVLPKDILFIEGYEMPASEYAGHEKLSFTGRCCLCGDENQILALLLRSPQHNEQTQGGFPSAGSRSPAPFPLVFGGFPETDIISEWVPCEACAFFMVRLERAPFDEKVTGCVPLISHSDANNIKMTVASIGKALNDRFESSKLLSVLLGILYDVVDLALDEETVPAPRVQALNYACRVVAMHAVDVSDVASTVFYNSALLQWGTNEQDLDLNETTTYPFEGVTVLMRSMRDCGLISEDDARLRFAVYERYLFYLVQQHYAAISSIGSDTPKSLLEDVLSNCNPEQVDGEGEVQSDQHRRNEAPISKLTGTYLLPANNSESFKRMGNMFTAVEGRLRHCTWDLLQELATQATVFGNANDFFKRYWLVKRHREGVQQLLQPMSAGEVLVPQQDHYR